MLLREIFINQFADIRRNEWPRALLMSAFFFLVIATYWILKPIKRGLIINYFGANPLELFGMTFTGAEAEQIGKVLNLIVAFDLVPFFIWLARRYSRHYIVLIFAVISSAAFILYAFLIDQPHEATVWTFYVFGDMFNTVMVALFWAFTNDIVSSGEAKRTYGLIGLGGVVGGFVGATVVSASVEGVGRAPLLLLCLIPMVLITIIAFAVHRLSSDNTSELQRPAIKGRKRAVAWEGAKLVLASRYLLAITAIIALYELVANVIDFQLAATVEASITLGLEKDAFFGLVGQVIGIGSILVQLFLTSFVMKRFGVGTALSFLPIVIFCTSVGFLLLPTLLFAAAMAAGHNTLNYSINQSARETLYTTTSPDVTYKAKAFIDIFVQRFAKVLSAVLNLAFVSIFVSGVRWLTLVTLGLVGLWFFLIRFTGRRFREMETAALFTKPPVKEHVKPTGSPPDA